ncbi:MAG: hypothetical protein ILO34_09135 [Kiritimatiellae bacterium]|nr:hypothetical protein [Kiritimatiellia bacterium]
MKKRIVFLAGGMLFACALCGADSYNVAEAISAASAAGNLGTYTDALGGEWRFGMAASNDVSTVSPFAQTYTKDGCNGYLSAGGEASVPFLAANWTGASHNILGATLASGSIVMHPDDVPTSYPCVAMELRPAKASLYAIYIEAADGNGGGGANYADGVLVCAYTNGVIASGTQISSEGGIPSMKKGLSLYLSPSIPLTIVVNPNLAHAYDTTLLAARIVEDDGSYVDTEDSVFHDYVGAVATYDISSTRFFRAKENGIYDFALLATHVEYESGAGDSDTLITLGKNGSPVLSKNCETGNSELRFGAGLFLRKGETLSFEIDSTLLASTPRCRAVVTEVAKVAGEPLIDLNELYYGIVNDSGATLPATVATACGNVTVSAGGNANGGSWFHEETWFADRYSYPAPGNYTGFASGTFPWVLLNNSTSMGPVNPDFSNEPMMPKEMLIHPDASRDTFIKCTVPTNIPVRTVMIVRDLMDGAKLGSSSDGVNAYATADWNVSGGEGWWSGGNSGLASLESGPISRVVVSDFDFSAGDKAAVFALNRIISHGCDSAGVQAYVFAAELIDGDKVVNCDIDGRQAADGEPCTFSGYGFAVIDGAYWNALYHLENTENDITFSNLKTAKGGDTTVSVRLATTDGSMIGFDNNGAGADPASADAFRNDYMYLYGQTVAVTISGLETGHVYDLYIYGTNAGHGYATFGGVSLNDGSGSNFSSSTLGAGMYFEKLEPDSSGCIGGTVYGDSGAGVFPGFQIVDVTPPRETLPLAIFIR